MSSLSVLTQEIKPGDLIFSRARWKEVQKTDTKITTIVVYFTDGSHAEYPLDSIMTVKRGTGVRVLPESSQKRTENPKKERSALEKAGGVAIAAGFVSGIIVFGIGSSLAVGLTTMIVTFSISLTYFYLVLKVNELEEWIEAHPAEDFVKGMDEFGVEAVLGGANPFGRSAEIKLRFPAGVLKKHLTNAMMDGYKMGLRDTGGRLDNLQEEFRCRQMEHEVDEWIHAMMKGQR